MDRDHGLAFLRESLDFIDEVDALARTMVEHSAPTGLLTRDLAVAIGKLTGTNPPLTPQTASTARAHLYLLAREGLLDAAWIPKDHHHG